MRNDHGNAAFSSEVLAPRGEGKKVPDLSNGQGTPSKGPAPASMNRDFITSATILRVLTVGFGLVILLLLAAGFFGVQSIQSIRTSVANLEEWQAVTGRLMEEIGREQAALSAVFYQLARDPELVDREGILTALDEADRHIDRVVSEVSGTPEAPLWQELKSSSTAFAAEARRLLASQDAETLLSLDLFHRHDQVVSIVTKLMAASNQKALNEQNQIRLRSRALFQTTFGLLSACLALSLLCAVLTVRVTTRLFEKMEWQAGELGRVSWHMVENQERTARRFSHELHDELGQSLTAVKANLLALASESDAGSERWQDCLLLVDGAIQNVRELSQLLRPTVLDDFGLDASLRWLCERFSHRTGIEADYHSSFAGRLSEETETHLFRIAQEALTNVARHSGASRVHLNLQEDSGRIRLRVEDNGHGLPADWANEKRGFGITGMRARARTVGGELTIRSANGNGVFLEVEVPREAAADAEKDSHLASR